MLFLLFVAGLWAGTQNALAGGGSFITLPTLILSGLDARLANIASTIALFPGQVTTGIAGRGLIVSSGRLSFRALVVINLIGGLMGAGLLIITPSSIFAHLVPWFVLFATCAFAWGSFKPKSERVPANFPLWAAIGLQGAVAIYGGYFGGGIGILMLALLTAMGVAVQAAGAIKNVLAAIINTSAVVCFIFVPHLPWLKIAMLGGGSIIGGYCGALLLKRINPRVLRICVICIGMALTVGLFLHPAG